ncbi:hypothetical protein KVT40_008631 [Elsinoe batatas]|uniref:Uncharacterized protein n=1 Tax=Elsinoe batatas TaxID=2601811 RepID=A0A8K0P9P7_9PEZI|nr:hypothetical protein KVT40_008631 [Elsinoe batatas]
MSKHRRLRSHSSFINPFRSRTNHSSTTQVAPIRYDTSIPPFNFAYREDFALSHTVTDPVLSEEASRRNDRKPSGSFKRRIRRLFSRGKPDERILPAQQVSAKQFHFHINTLDDDAADSVPESQRPSLSIRRSQDVDFGSTRGSIDNTAPDSRATSWTNSTIAGTLSSSAMGSKRLSSIRELPSQGHDRSSQGEMPDRDERPSLHLRRKRQTNSEESQRLYDALRMQITSTQLPDPLHLTATTTQPPGPATSMACEATADSSAPLPKSNSAAKSSKPTIRAVSPDSASETTPVAIVTRESGEHDDVQPYESNAPDIDRRSQEGRSKRVSDPRRSPEIEHDHRTKRLQKAENRWRDALDEESPRLLRALRHIEEDNSYRFRSVPTSPQNEGMPIAVRHRPDSNDASATESGPEQFVLASPSIYSGRDIPHSTRSNSPEVPDGTMVTVIGREVKKFRLDDQPKVGHAPTASRPSNEWRAWATDQMTEFEDGIMTKAFTLKNLDLDDAQPPGRISSTTGTSQSTLSAPNCTRSEGTRHDHPSPASRLRSTKTRQKMEKRKSSVGLTTEDGASDTRSRSGEKGLKTLTTKMSQISIGAIRRISSSTRITSATAKPCKNATIIPTIADEDLIAPVPPPPPPFPAPPAPRTISPSTSGLSLFPVATRPAPVPPPRPARTPVQLQPQHSRNPSTSTAQTTIIHSTPSRTQTSLGTNRAKSSFDLRARFKPSKESMRETSINIRRRMVPTPDGKERNKVEVFEDMTLQRISEGPYAFSPEGAYGETSILALSTVEQETLFEGREGRSGKENISSETREKAWETRSARPVVSLRSLRERREVKSGLGEKPSGGLREQSESPGQKMAEEFLRGKGRRSPSKSPGVGSSPMFI